MTRTMFLFFAVALAMMTISFAPVAQAEEREGMRAYGMQRDHDANGNRDRREMRNHHRMRDRDGDRDHDRRVFRENCEVKVGGRCVVR